MARLTALSVTEKHVIVLKSSEMTVFWKIILFHLGDCGLADYVGVGRAPGAAFGVQGGLVCVARVVIGA